MFLTHQTVFTVPVCLKYYIILSFKVLYLFVKLVQHKIQEKRKDNLYQNTKKPQKTNVTQRSELQKLYTTCKEKIQTRLKLI